MNQLKPQTQQALYYFTRTTPTYNRKQHITHDKAIYTAITALCITSSIITAIMILSLAGASDTNRITLPDLIIQLFYGVMFLTISTVGAVFFNRIRKLY